MITIAITGRSGVGKSTVTTQFTKAGIPVVDADQVARDVLAAGSDCLPKLQVVFGENICKDGVLDRRLLADRAFSTPEGTELLTKITHPEIIRRICAAKEAAHKCGAKIFAIDGAVILGTPCEAECDRFVVVTAPFDVSVARIVARDGITQKMAQRRLNAQIPEELLCARADYIIENDGDTAALVQQIENTIINLWRDADATKAPL
ncbi:MAG: dephospho-CoA kinase [Faecalibacterium sp.]